MIADFEFFTATPVVFGAGRLQSLEHELYRLGEGRLLVVSDQGVVGAGILGELGAVLDRAGRVYTVLADVEPNPSVETVQRGEALLREAGCSALVAIGGGSSIDAAKAIGILARNEPPLQRYEGANKFPNTPLPVIAIPTTAGTGSEVTMSAVITDRARRYKMSVRGGAVAPKLALLDPQLLRSLPAGVAAATGMDALTHAVEAHVSLWAAPPAQALALHAIALIAAHLRPFVANRGHPTAAGNMLVASMLAGAAFAHARVGVVHAMAHPLGGRYDVPHGVANAIVLPYAMEYNLIACPERFAQVARAMGEQVDGLTTLEAARCAVDAVRRLAADIGIPLTLRSTAAREEGIADMAGDALEGGLALTNPRTVTFDDVVAIYRRAFGAI